METTRSTQVVEPVRVPIGHDRPTVELLRRLHTARSAINSWKHEEEHVRELLIKTFGADHLGVWEGTIESHPMIKIAVRTQHRFDLAAFREDHPGLCEQYQTTGEVTTVKVDPRILGDRP